MLTATEAFMDALEKWLKAVREDDFQVAKQRAKHLILAGELLVIHPDFVRSFKEHCEGCNPKDALFQMCQFLLCATDGRAKTLKQYIKGNKP